jgi:hypothetical protein
VTLGPGDGPSSVQGGGSGDEMIVSLSLKVCSHNGIGNRKKDIS